MIDRTKIADYVRQHLFDGTISYSGLQDYLHPSEEGKSEGVDVDEESNIRAEGGPIGSYSEWLKAITKHYGFNPATEDYDMNAYYQRHPSEAWSRLFKEPYHFDDGDEYGTFKKPSHPTYPDRGEKSWNKDDTVFFPSDRQMKDSDRILHYLGSDSDYNNGATKVVYKGGEVLPNLFVYPDWAGTDMKRNKENTGWIYNDYQYAKGGNLNIENQRGYKPSLFTLSGTDYKIPAVRYDEGGDISTDNEIEMGSLPEITINGRKPKWWQKASKNIREFLTGDKYEWHSGLDQFYPTKMGYYEKAHSYLDEHTPFNFDTSDHAESRDNVMNVLNGAIGRRDRMQMLGATKVEPGTYRYKNPNYTGQEDEERYLKQCAENANMLSRMQGRPTAGNAWTRHGIFGDTDLVVNPDVHKGDRSYGANMLYGLFNSGVNEQNADYVQKHIDDVDLQSGDIVDMRVRGSSYKHKAYNEGDDNRANTHTGNILVVPNKDGKKTYVVHMGAKSRQDGTPVLRVDPIGDLLDDSYTSKYLITGIRRPNRPNNNAMGGGIHIKPSHEGRFTEYLQRTGKTLTEALHSPDAHVRQMANFARNAKGWNHANGGNLFLDGGAEGETDKEGNPNKSSHPTLSRIMHQSGGEQNAFAVGLRALVGNDNNYYNGSYTLGHDLAYNKNKEAITDRDLVNLYLDNNQTGFETVDETPLVLNGKTYDLPQYKSNMIPLNTMTLRPESKDVINNMIKNKDLLQFNSAYFSDPGIVERYPFLKGYEGVLDDVGSAGISFKMDDKGNIYADVFDVWDYNGTTGVGGNILEKQIRNDDNPNNGPFILRQRIPVVFNRTDDSAGKMLNEITARRWDKIRAKYKSKKNGGNLFYDKL